MHDATSRGASAGPDEDDPELELDPVPESSPLLAPEVDPTPDDEDPELVP